MPGAGPRDSGRQRPLFHETHTLVEGKKAMHSHKINHFGDTKDDLKPDFPILALWTFGAGQVLVVRG